MVEAPARRPPSPPPHRPWSSVWWLAALALAAPAARAQEGAPPPAAAAPPAEEQAGSFGAQLSALGLDATWSGYGDLIFWARPAPATFDSSHFNPVLGARIGERLHAELELEIEGEGVRAEYAFLDLTLSRALVVRMGKMLMPIGQFNEVLHPSFRWNMISRPAMFHEVMPAVWSSVGLELRGTAEPARGLSLNYAAFVVNGLAAERGALSGPLVARSGRANPVDNNSDKMVGGRFGLTLGTGPRSATLGVSGASGALDAAASRRWSVLDVDLQVRFGPFTLWGEAAQSFLGPDSDPLRSFERGAYLLADWAFGRLHLDLRWDWAETARGDGARDEVHQLAPGLLFRVSPLWSVRLEAGLDLRGDAAERLVRLGAMAAFSF